MALELPQRLKELGSELENPPSSTDALSKLLEEAGTCLSELDQSPSELMLELMEPFLNAIVRPELLKHHDREIKLLVATCICEITRITAPEPPYTDDVFRDIFCLIVSTFSGLRDTSGSSFQRIVVILETLAKYRSCVVMLDLECDHLVNEVFGTFFSVARDDHAESVLNSMQTIMVVLLEESEDIRDDLLLVLLSVLGRKKNDVSMASRRLAMKVIENCAQKLEPGIKKFLISAMSGDAQALSSQVDYHGVIFDIYTCAPQILSGVTPCITRELLVDQLDARLKAVKLVGDLFALPRSSVSGAFQPVFSEFLTRLTDRVVEIRMSVLEHVKIFLLSNPKRSEAPQIISALSDRLFDYDENVRKQVIAVVCDVACHAPTSIPVEIVKLVAERLQDKSLMVKEYTMERLAEIHRVHCLQFSKGLVIPPNRVDWIPGKILRCLYDKDFRSDTIESVFCVSLFPTEFSVKDKVEHWVRIFSIFDKVEVKALEKILEQKQRLQQEMQRYLSLRQMYQDDGDASEFQKKIHFCFRTMSRCFSDPVKAEEDFQILDQLKDTNIWMNLRTLLDPSTSFLQAFNSRDDLLKEVSEKHELRDFLSTFSMKCAYLFFDKEHVKEILLEAARQKSNGSPQFISSCMNLLVIIARFSPLLLNGSVENLVMLLKDDHEVIKEGVLHVLAKAGGSIQEQLGASSSSVELTLERICVEGSRRQAKFAVHALAAVTKDDGLKSLSVLYKRLVDMLEEKMHLPAVLQSLGCIAQTAMPVFETRENEIEEFIKCKILECSNNVDDIGTESWDERSDMCSLKVFGIKALVKSYLPVKDVHLRLGIDKLLGILKNFLSFGEISRDIKSSMVDKAHLRLASANAILRLSRHWDHKIPVDIFHLTLRTPEISFPEAKKAFLNKVYQFIKDRLLDIKYACVFLFSMGSQLPNVEEGKHNFSDIIEMCQQTTGHHFPIQSDAKFQMGYLENILPHFVHALAHNSYPDVQKCTDVKAFELMYRQLHFFLSILVHGNDDGKSEAITNKKRENISVIFSIFQRIKHSDDVVDTAKSKNSHAICDLGMLVSKHLAGKDDLQGLTGSVSLPSSLYLPHVKEQDSDALVNEEESWLVDKNVLAHLESLNLDTEKRVHSEIANGEVLKDSEADGNEVPLGKMLKHLKARGSKAKKVLRNMPSPAGIKNAANDVDILKMVREINLGNLDINNKFEATNGHESFPSEPTKDKKHQIKKRKKSSDAMSVPVPKRRRSFSGQAAFRSSRPFKKSKHASSHNMPQARVSSSQSMTVESDILTKVGSERSAPLGMGESAKSDLLVSSFQKNLGISVKRKEKSSHGIHDEEDRKDWGVDHCGFMKHDLGTEADETEPAVNFSSTMVSFKKRKRRSIAGLAKCTSKEAGNNTTDLIDSRIKVWWPIDKQFYEGVVQSYDAKKRKHVVLYDDGDVEVLNLEKERWELIDKDSEIWHLSKCPNSREVVKGKRTPRKNLKHGERRLSGGKTAKELCDAEVRANSDVATPEPAPISDVDYMNSGALQEKEILGGGNSLKIEEEPDIKGKSLSQRKDNLDIEENQSGTDRCEDEEEEEEADEEEDKEELQPSSKQKQVVDSDAVASDAEESDVEVKSCSVNSEPSISRSASKEEVDAELSNSDGKQISNAESSSTYESDDKTSDSRHSEVSDNETLGNWRRRAKKSD